MTPTEFREALAALGLTQQGAAKAWSVDERTIRNWADYRGKGPPLIIAGYITLLLEIYNETRIYE